MRIGVIRADLPQPVLLTDLETTSQQSTTRPKGQCRYLSRPTTTELETVLANATTGAGAVIEGSDISGSFPLTINGTNDDLKVKTSSGAAFTTVLIANAAYASITTLLAAINTALTGTGITARQGTGSGQRVALESNTKGVNSYVAVDSVAGGSVANTPLGFGAGAVTRDMPAASAFITALNPALGTLNVSTSAINAVGAGNNANALTRIPTSRGTHTALAEAIAPKFTETAVVIESFLYGNIAALKNASFNPDPKRQPPSSAPANGAAIAVVADDGSTAFTFTAPTVSSATLNSPTAGAVTIAGTGLGNTDWDDDTAVKFTGAISKKLTQRQIEAAGGSVSYTAIVVPASLIPGATTTTTSVQVRVRQRASSVVAVS